VDIFSQVYESDIVPWVKQSSASQLSILGKKSELILNLYGNIKELLGGLENMKKAYNSIINHPNLAELEIGESMIYSLNQGVNILQESLKLHKPQYETVQ